MARTREPDVDVEAVEVEEVDYSTPEEGAEPKKKKEPARGELPEGFVTPIGLAKVLTERGMHTNRAGEVVEVRPQMVYSYIRNAPKDDPFPLQEVEDSLGKTRSALNLEEGLDWWTRKNERVQARKANAAEKAEKKARKAAEKAEAVEAEAGVAEGAVEEVE
jgi:hypothetical protein